MFSLFKAECYQLRHRLAPLLLLLLTFLASLGLTFWVLSSLLANNAVVNRALLGNQTLFFFGRGLSETPQILSFITLALTYNNETKNRTLINTVSFGYHRSWIVITKALVALIYLLLALLLACLGLLLAFSFLDIQIQTKDVWGLFRGGIFPSIPLYLGYITLFLIPSLLFSNQSAAISTYFALSFLNPMLTLIYSQLTQSTISSANRAFRYVFTFLNTGDPLFFFNWKFNFMPLIALLYSILFLWIACKLFNRAEVK